MRPDDGIRIDTKKFGTSLRRLAPGNSVGVKELARLISRIKHREFGVLVTTSYVNEQAYREASSGSERWYRRQDHQNDAKDQDDSADGDDCRPGPADAEV